MTDLIFDLSRPGIPLRRGHLGMGGAGPGGRIEVTSQYVERDGRPWLPIMGEFQYSRHPHRYWGEELRKMKACGIEIVPTYVLWSHHEEEEGVFDWSGDRDLRRFIQLCQETGLGVVVRMGPFCHGEARNGGLPDWLYGYPFEARSNDPRYLAYAQRLYRQIGEQVRGLTWCDGGPIIGIQCDNEYADSAAPWETTFVQATEYTPKGAGGDEHLLTLKRFAREAGLEVPLYTATGWGAETPIIPSEFLPMYGGYAFFAWLDDPSTQGPSGFLTFQKQHGRAHPRFDTASVPFACCEIGGGMQPFYRNRPHVPPASVEAMHVVQLGSGSNIMGYYVYHGGTNPTGRRGFLNEHRCPRKSYDFQAPIREFGQLGETAHRLRRQFLFLQSWGHELAPMETVLEHGGLVEAGDVSRVRAAVRARGRSGFLFISNYQDHAEMREHAGVRFRIGADTVIPACGPATVLRDAAAILPFGLGISGLSIVSSTLTPLTRLTVGGVEQVVMREVPGFPPEIVFDAVSVSAIEGDATTERDGDRLVVRPAVGFSCGPLRATARAGRIAHLWIVSDEESLALWRLPFAGGERIVLSRQGLFAGTGGLTMYSLGDAGGDLTMMPPPPRTPVCRGGTLEFGGMVGGAARYRWRSDWTPPPCPVRRIAADRVVVTVPAGAMDQGRELFLKIEAIGDVAAAYIQGELVHDWFLDGRPWWIGLKRFARAGRELEVFLRVSAPRRENAVVYTQMAAMAVREDADGAKAEVRSVEIVPEHRIDLEP